MSAESRDFGSFQLVTSGGGIAYWCLSFKADIDDLRKSPGLHIVEPNFRELPPSLAGAAGVKLTGAEQIVAASVIKVVLVKHGAFYSLDRTHLTGEVVIDARGIRR